MKDYLCTTEHPLTEDNIDFYDYNNHHLFAFVVGDDKEIYIKCIACHTTFQVRENLELIRQRILPTPF